MTLSELKRVAYILKDIAIPNSKNRLVYYRMFDKIVTNNQTVVLTQYQYNN